MLPSKLFFLLGTFPSVIIKGAHTYCGKLHKSRNWYNIQHQSLMIPLPIQSLVKTEITYILFVYLLIIYLLQSWGLNPGLSTC